MSRFRIALDAGNAHKREIISLHNWVKGTGSIHEAEASFLRDEEDLMSIRSRPDEAQSFFENCVVKAGVKVSRILRRVGALTWARQAISMSIETTSNERTDKASIVDHPPKLCPETHTFISPRDRSTGD